MEVSVAVLGSPASITVLMVSVDVNEATLNSAQFIAAFLTNIEHTEAGCDQAEQAYTPKRPLLEADVIDTKTSREILSYLKHETCTTERETTLSPLQKQAWLPLSATRPTLLCLSLD